MRRLTAGVIFALAVGLVLTAGVAEANNGKGGHKGGETGLTFAGGSQQGSRLDGDGNWCLGEDNQTWTRYAGDLAPGETFAAPVYPLCWQYNSDGTWKHSASGNLMLVNAVLSVRGNANHAPFLLEIIAPDGTVKSRTVAAVGNNFNGVGAVCAVDGWVYYDADRPEQTAYGLGGYAPPGEWTMQITNLGTRTASRVIWEPRAWTNYVVYQGEHCREEDRRIIYGPPYPEAWPPPDPYSWLNDPDPYAWMD